MIDLSKRIADPTAYGWKAHYLSVLIHHGFIVPRALAIRPGDNLNTRLLDYDKAYAVRSSGIAEDSEKYSFAGHFSTRLNVRGHQDLLSAVEEVRSSALGQMPMGVVVQEMVEHPLLSGVAFSCHPVSLSPFHTVVTWSTGLGHKLVSGEALGHDIVVQNGVLSKHALKDWPLEADSLQHILYTLKQLEDLAGRPVDIEWCIADEGHELILLQMRPVVLGAPGTTILDSPESFDSLPGAIKSHSKIALRANAARLNISMGRARAVTATRHEDLPQIDAFPKSMHSAGRSIVLLHPSHVDGRIVREFSRDSATDIEFFTLGCRRYAVRQYPQLIDATDTVLETLATGLRNSHLSCVIEQELLQAYATGILRQTMDGYLIEVALGHFVPKGYVETSAFALSKDLQVSLRKSVRQSRAYHFMNGHVVVESSPEEVVDIRDQDLQMLIRTFQPLLDQRPDAALEFGYLGAPGELEPYLIDVAESDASTGDFTADNIARGVVSKGSAAGQVVDLRSQKIHDDLNAHLHDQASSGTPAQLEPTIYLASSASVDLLPLVRACHSSSGFVFERASLLSHLPVVLREKGIPAVILPPHAIEELLSQTSTWHLDTTAEPVVQSR